MSRSQRTLQGRYFLKEIVVARHYGFCMGVKRAIAIAEETMAEDQNVTILNEIVHNDAVVEKFALAGVGQVRSINEIKGGTVIISAHGASPQIIAEAAKKGLKIVDATCPLVIRIHKIIKRLAEKGYHILHFGDAEHDETIGIVGHAPDRVIVFSSARDIENIRPLTGRLALTSQTTAGLAEFIEVARKVKKRFPRVEVFNTICNATNQRQAAIMELAPRVDIMLVVGSKTSANSKRLAQISKAICPRSYLINSAADINPEWFEEKQGVPATVGLSAGASTPDFLIDGAILRLKEIARNSLRVTYPPRKSSRNKLALKKDP
jgi:4-hydroxy-3-methylbut-2-enyl diphosphate reductase